MVPQGPGAGSPIEQHLGCPRNAGKIAAPDAVGAAVNPACGDELHLTLRLVDGVVAEARFQASGCAAALAAGSVLTELIEGCHLRQISQTITAEAVSAALGGLPPGRRHAAALAAEAARLAASSALDP